ncbi:hypothetical protein GCWU000323_00369 [Leptotrichia hofstadii F0254]|uniref:Tetratricopeptide repeat protein n=2 Tax=Leptotrichia hofstadii TaxID=157688 RepID=C9MUZ9_9FUSO|nr:hypothetical protein GCWU000323_00369 [Leptotrichia hofstadii F0254]
MEKFSDEKEIEDDYNYGITLFYCGYFEKAKEMLLRCYKRNLKVQEFYMHWHCAYIILMIKIG